MGKLGLLIAITLVAKTAFSQESPTVLVLASDGMLCNGNIISKAPLQVVTSYHCIQEGITDLTLLFNVTIDQAGTNQPVIIPDENFKEFLPIENAKLLRVEVSLDFAILEVTNPTLSGKITDSMVANLIPSPVTAELRKSILTIKGVSTKHAGTLVNQCRMVGLAQTTFNSVTVAYPLLTCEKSFTSDETSLSGSGVYIGNKLVGIVKGGSADALPNSVIVAIPEPGTSMRDEEFKLPSAPTKLPKWGESGIFFFVLFR